MSNILRTENLGIDFGGLTAVNNLNIEVNENEIVGLIGPNGAGKTTVFNMLTNVHTPSRGKVILLNKDISILDVSKTNIAGVSRTFQNIRLFSKMSVLDNVKAALSNSYKYSIFDSMFHTPKYYRQEKKIENKALELLKIFNLDNEIDTLSSSLPYGKQRRLEIARALATNPKLLLLDEPAAGMNPQETEELMDMIRLVKDKFKISILLIEHDMNLVMNICERIYVLNYGVLLAKGTPFEIKNNPEVIKAYLGD